MKNTRNSSTIVHIDHDKSALSDRIIQICGGLSGRKMTARVLDSMNFECERRITIKAQNVTLDYKTNDGETYQLNFIDTSGHVDFSYGVSRLLAACEGTLLVVDAGQGVEAQTLTNCHTAMGMNLEVVPVFNEIDPLTANPERITDKIEDIVSIDAHGTIRYLAKIGVDVPDVLEYLVRDIPPLEGDPDAPLQALITDSWFDNRLDVVSLVRTKNGTMHKGDKIKVMSTSQVYSADRLGIFTPKQIDRAELRRDEVGWLVCTIRDIPGASVSDILTATRNPTDKVPPGFKKVKPQVYVGLFPVSSDDYEGFRDASGRLSLNDISLLYEPESSTALGFDFCRGSLGLLYIEIIQEHLGREYDLDLITTAPTVVYEVETTSKEAIYVNSPSKLLSPNNIQELRESIAECHMLLPQELLGNVIILCIEKHDVQTNMVYHGKQVALIYEIPVAEVVLDFSDRLKSTSRDYASLDYNFKRFQASSMVRVDVLTDDERVGVLTLIIRNDNTPYRGCELVEKMEKPTLRQQFNIAIRTAIDNHIITRSAVKQLRKDALTKRYGGDVSRKKKLLRKQKEGKKRMEQVGNVELSQEAFLAILHVGKNGKQLRS